MTGIPELRLRYVFVVVREKNDSRPITAKYPKSQLLSVIHIHYADLYYLHTPVDWIIIKKYLIIPL